MNRTEYINLIYEIYERAHDYHNNRGRLTLAYAAAGFPGKPTQGQLNGLDDYKSMALKIAVLDVVKDALKLGLIGRAIPDIDAAIEEAANVIPDPQELTIVQQSLTEYAALREALSPMIDSNLIMAQIAGAQGAIDILSEKDDPEDQNSPARINRFDFIKVTLP